MIKTKSKIVNRLEGLGLFFFYLTIKIAGQRGAYFMLYPVIFCYAFFNTGMKKLTDPYYELIFGRLTKKESFLHRFNHFMNFGRLMVDRGVVGLRKDIKFNYTTKGKKGFLDALEKGCGVILLTAHVGSWQVVLSAIDQPGRTVSSLMFRDDGLATKHFFELAGVEPPFNIIDVDNYLGGSIETINSLLNGDIVMIMGDRYFKGPYINIPFLGKNAKIPASPFILAGSAGCAVVPLLTAKSGKNSNEVLIGNPVWPTRRPNAAQLEEMAGAFVKMIKEYVYKYPYQWYNFYNFWNE